ncbi:MAG: hypothetical protein A2029_03155 [Chloroflexi bacterium RBG_19FT_COMBO_47_9]|nr:MAG: hypothetical protein A2029_03155 [Chloroflexi bacterium RBG_19FT_COMBO_47_9]
MMKIKQKAHWWIDMLLFFGFLVAFFLSLTGVELHQWVGILGGVLVTYHLLVHWNWVDAVSQKIFRSRISVVQIKFLVDSLLFAGFALIVGTGLVISSWLNISLSNNEWLRLHISASITTMMILLVKLALHWRWISRTTRDIFADTGLELVQPAKLQLSPIERQSMERRDFLKVMGVVAGVSLIALINATKGLASIQDGETSSISHSATSDTDQWFINNSGNPRTYGMDSSMDSSCSIQCGKRCSYPGHCRRYIDTNNNNCCNFGECA